MVGKQHGSEPAWQESDGRGRSQKGAPFLSDPSQRAEVEESTSRPQLPQPDPTQEVSGPRSSSIPMLAPVLEEKVVFPCGEKSLSPLPKLCDTTLRDMFFPNIPPWLLVPMGPLATEGDEPVAAPLPGTGDSRRLLPASQSPSRVCENETTWTSREPHWRVPVLI